MTYLTDKKQNERIESIEKKDFTKVPNEYRSLIISLLVNHCKDDKLIKAISKRKIGDCRIFDSSILKDRDGFYSSVRYSSTFSNIFQIAISKRAIPAIGMKFEKFYLSELTKIQNKRTFNFRVKGYLYILFYYAIKGKDKVYISIYNGLMENDYKELIEYSNNIRSDYKYPSTLIGSDYR